MNVLRLAVAAFVFAFAGAATAAETAPNDPFAAGYAAFANGDYATAASTWQPLADRGDPRAQFNLGVLHAEGRGFTRDMKQAMELWMKAAKRGHVRAAHNLALALLAGEPAENGRFREPDYGAAIRYLQIGVKAGYANSEYTLGKLYAEGQGVEADAVRAAELYLAAAEAGFARAQYNLGKIYRDGLGVGQDLGESIRWFREAAERGHPRAQDKLSDRFARGDGVAQDDVEALKWAILAAAQGFEPAAERRAVLTERMSDDAIAEAERRAAEFKPRQGAPET